MVGFYATADSSQTIRTDLDNELEEARWFTREEVIAVLEHREGTNFSRILGPPGGGAGALAHSDPSLKEADPKAAAAKAAAEGADDDEPPFRIPPITAIAGVLIQEWAYGRVKHLPSSEPEKVVRRGNL
jgi:NAD+ diphosphatase